MSFENKIALMPPSQISLLQQRAITSCRVYRLTQQHLLNQSVDAMFAPMLAGKSVLRALFPELGRTAG